MPGRSDVGSAADTADAVGEMYPSEAGDAIFVWNVVPVRLSYGHHVAALLDDLVPLRAKALLTA